MKTIQIKSLLWSDDWFLDLSDREKIVWIYLLSNDQCNIAGIYKVTPAVIRRMTDITIGEIEDIFDRFEKDRKAVYYKSYIILLNRIKYNSGSIKISKGVMSIIDKLPNNIIEYILTLSETRLYDFVIKHYRLSENKLINGSVTVKPKTKSTFEKRIKDFTVEVDKFIEENPKYTSVRDKFIDYWTEKSETGNTFKREDQKHFSLKVRLDTFLDNKKENSKSKIDGIYREEGYVSKF